MQTKRSWRNRALTLAVLMFLVGLPELATAQQSGLFPNAPIRRQRTPCNQEDAIYKLYRNQYYGYHPTCWRRFPDGWGCPSPEAPDREKSFREIKPRPPESLDADLDDEGQMKADDRGGPSDEGPAPRPNLPPVPENSKPLFNLDNQDQAPAGNAPGAGQSSPPRTSRRSPSSRGDAPALLPPMERSANGRISSRSRSRDAMDDRPLLATTNDGENDRIDAGNLEPVGDEPNALPEVEVDGSSALSSPASSQGRRGGMLSSLFGGTGWSWRRR